MTDKTAQINTSVHTSSHIYHELYAAVRFRREDIHHCVTVPVQGNGSVGFQLLPVQSAQHAHVVSGACSGVHDAVVAVDHLVELTNDQRH